MSKTKNKSHNEVEHLNGLIRQLKKQVNKLTRDNSQLRRELNRALDTKEAKVQPKRINTATKIRSEVNGCPQCNGQLTKIDLGVRKLISCSDCEYRKVETND